MKRPIMLALLIGVCFALELSLSSANAAPLVSVIGSSSRTLDFPQKPTGQTRLVYPVSVTELKDQESIHVQLMRLALGDRDLETHPDWLSFKPDGARPDRGDLVFEIPAEKLFSAGTYTLTVEFWKASVIKPAAASESDKQCTEKDSTAKESDPPPSGPAKKTISDQGSLTVTVVRPAGTLDVGAPLKIERVTGWPAFIDAAWNPCLDDCLTPRVLAFVETSGRNAVQLSKAAGNVKAVIRLRADANSAEVSRLDVSLPAEIPAGQRMDVGLNLSAPTLTGTATGNLEFTSEQLQPRRFSVPVEVSTRLSRLWLVFVIVGGILLGYFTRTWLESRKLRNRARAALLRVGADYQDALKRISDRTFQGKLQEQLRLISRMLERKFAKDTDLTEAATTGSTQLETILTEYETARNGVETAIATNLKELGDIAGVAEAVPQAKELAEFLGSVEKKLETGAVTDAKNEIDQALPGRLTRLKSALTARASKLQTNLQRGDSWPETGRDAVLNDARTEVTTFLSTHEGRNANAGDMGASMQGFDLLIRLLRPRLADFRAEAIRDLAVKVQEGLGEIPSIKDSERIRRLGEAVKAFETSAESATGAGLFETLMRDEELLRGALKRALTSASKAVQESKDKPDGLDNNEYRKAMNDVREREGLKALGGPATAVSPAGAAARPPDADAAEAVQEVGLFRILSPSEIRVGTPAVFSLEPVQPAGAATVADLAVAWWINGKSVEPSGAGGKTCRYTPQAGERELEVRARITGRGPAGPLDQTTTHRFLTMQPAGRDLADELEQQADRIGLGQTAIAGILITLAGYSIFEGTFVGSLADALTALFWGFAIDVTVAKAQEYGTPLLARQPKFTPAE